MLSIDVAYRGAMTMFSKPMQGDVPLVMIPYKTAAYVRMYVRMLCRRNVCKRDAYRREGKVGGGGIVNLRVMKEMLVP